MVDMNRHQVDIERAQSVQQHDGINPTRETDNEALTRAGGTIQAVGDRCPYKFSGRRLP